MIKTWRSLAAAAALSAVSLLTPGLAGAQTCNAGLATAFAGHPAEYTQLATALVPQVGNFNTKLAATVDQATYQSLLTDARTLAGSLTNGRVLITVPDGTVVIDTAKPDDPTNVTPNVFANSYQHFKNKMVNENHNSRIAILDTQEWPCGVGLESKFSTSDNQRELYVAVRLGAHLDANGTARLSIKQ
jgi:hypothetical protein